jgi:hypothetical protein
VVPFILLVPVLTRNHLKRLVIMNQTYVFNDIIDNGKRTHNSCTGCIKGYKDGKLRFGKLGCTIPVVTSANSSLYEAWVATLPGGKQEQFLCCLKCFFRNVPCKAVSIEVGGKCLVMTRSD